LKKVSVLQSTIIPIASYKTWERIQIDLIDMRYKSITIDGVNYNYISHVIDHFSSFNIIWALAFKSAEEVVLGLRTRVFSYFGLPKIFHSDNGTEFKNKFVSMGTRKS
jgi:transposase InsO family protein